MDAFQSTSSFCEFNDFLRCTEIESLINEVTSNTEEYDLIKPQEIKKEIDKDKEIPRLYRKKSVTLKPIEPNNNVQTIGSIRRKFESEQIANWTPILKADQNLISNCNLNNLCLLQCKEKLMEIVESQRPMTKTSWETARKITKQNKHTYIVVDGKKIRLSGCAVKKTQNFVYNSFRPLLKNESKEPFVNNNENNAAIPALDAKIIRKRGLLSTLNDNFLPGPLSKKPRLNNNNFNSVEDLKLFSVPSIGLEVFPRIGHKLDSVACIRLNGSRSNDGFMDKKWAEFAVSMVAAENEKLSSHIFRLPFQNNQNRILFRGDPDFKYKKQTTYSKNNVSPDLSHLKLPLQSLHKYKPQNEIEKTVVNVLEDILRSVSISEVQDDIGVMDDYVPVEVKRSSVNSDVLNKSLKKNRELSRLDVTVIDVSDEVGKDHSKCSKEWCKLGCVCSSLETSYMLNEHCGRISCMLTACKCKFGKFDEGDNRDEISKTAVANLQHHMNRYLAKEEQKFRRTVIKTKDNTIVIGASRRGQRLPKKFQDFIVSDNMSENKQTDRPLPTVIVHLNKLPPNLKIEPFCMVHCLYRCFCKGVLTNGTPIKINDLPTGVNGETNITIAHGYIGQSNQHYSVLKSQQSKLISRLGKTNVKVVPIPKQRGSEIQTPNINKYPTNNESRTKTTNLLHGQKFHANVVDRTSINFVSLNNPKDATHEGPKLDITPKGITKIPDRVTIKAIAKGKHAVYDKTTNIKVIPKGVSKIPDRTTYIKIAPKGESEIPNKVTSKRKCVMRAESTNIEVAPKSISKIPDRATSNRIASKGESEIPDKVTDIEVASKRKCVMRAEATNVEVAPKGESEIPDKVADMEVASKGESEVTDIEVTRKSKRVIRAKATNIKIAPKIKRKNSDKVTDIENSNSLLNTLNKSSVVLENTSSKAKNDALSSGSETETIKNQNPKSYEHLLAEALSLLQNPEKNLNTSLPEIVFRQVIIYKWKQLVTDFQSFNMYLWVTAEEPYRVYATTSGKVRSKQSCLPIVYGKSLKKKILMSHKSLKYIMCCDVEAFSYAAFVGRKFAWELLCTFSANKENASLDPTSSKDSSEKISFSESQASPKHLYPTITSVQGSYSNNSHCTEITKESNLQEEIIFDEIEIEEQAIKNEKLEGEDYELPLRSDGECSNEDIKSCKTKKVIKKRSKSRDSIKNDNKEFLIDIVSKTHSQDSKINETENNTINSDSCNQDTKIIKKRAIENVSESCNRTIKKNKTAKSRIPKSDQKIKKNTFEKPVIKNVPESFDGDIKKDEFEKPVTEDITESCYQSLDTKVNNMENASKSPRQDVRTSKRTNDAIKDAPIGRNHVLKKRKSENILETSNQDQNTNENVQNNAKNTTLSKIQTEKMNIHPSKDSKKQTGKSSTSDVHSSKNDTNSSEQNLETYNGASTSNTSQKPVKYHWLLLNIGDKFHDILVASKNFCMSYKDTMDAMTLAEKTGKTCKYPNGIFEGSIPEFGAYAIPGNRNQEIFLGPFIVDEEVSIEISRKPISKLVWGTWTKQLFDPKLIVWNRSDDENCETVFYLQKNRIAPGTQLPAIKFTENTAKTQKKKIYNFLRIETGKRQITSNPNSLLKTEEINTKLDDDEDDVQFIPNNVSVIELSDDEL